MQAKIASLAVVAALLSGALLSGMGAAAPNTIDSQTTAQTTALEDIESGDLDPDDAVRTVSLDRPTPFWYDETLRNKVHEAAMDGNAYNMKTDEEVPMSSSHLFVRPGNLMVSPTFCTMNFIYASNGDLFIGSAGHCVDFQGQAVQITVAPDVFLEVGTVDSFQNGGIGDDWALIDVYDQVESRVDADTAYVLGPSCDKHQTGAGLTDPVPVKHAGHGLGIGFGVGTPRAGVATATQGGATYMEAAISFGDSGSPILTTKDPSCSLGRGLGIVTHIIVFGPNFTVSAGTLLTEVPASLVQGNGNPVS